MAERYQVVRGQIKWKGTLYFTGDLLPENFTDKDRARHMYSRRIELVEIKEQPKEVPPVKTPKGTPASSETTPPTGTKPTAAKAKK